MDVCLCVRGVTRLGSAGTNTEAYSHAQVRLTDSTQPLDRPESMGWHPLVYTGKGCAGAMTHDTLCLTWQKQPLAYDPLRQILRNNAGEWSAIVRAGCTMHHDSAPTQPLTQTLTNARKSMSL